MVFELKGLMRNSKSAFWHTKYANGNEELQGIYHIGDDDDGSEYPEPIGTRRECYLMSRSSGNSCWSVSSHDSECEPFNSLPLSFEFTSSERVKCLDQSDGCRKYCDVNDNCIVADGERRVVVWNDMVLEYQDDQPSLNDFVVTLCGNGKTIYPPNIDYCNPMKFDPSHDCSFHIFDQSNEIQGFTDEEGFGVVHRVNYQYPLAKNEYFVERDKTTLGMCIETEGYDGLCWKTIKDCSKTPFVFMDPVYYYEETNNIQCPLWVDDLFQMNYESMTSSEILESDVSCKILFDEFGHFTLVDSNGHICGNEYFLDDFDSPLYDLLDRDPFVPDFGVYRCSKFNKDKGFYIPSCFFPPQDSGYSSTVNSSDSELDVSSSSVASEENTLSVASATQVALFTVAAALLINLF